VSVNVGRRRDKDSQGKQQKAREHVTLKNLSSRARDAKPSAVAKILRFVGTQKGGRVVCLPPFRFGQT